MKKNRKTYWVLLSAFFYGFLIICPLLSYDKEIKSISLIMAENIAKAGKRTIAVVDFTDLQGNVTELGRFLAEEFSVSLASAGKGFEVVDRTHLKTLLQEHKLSSTGLIDPQTARKLGQIAGVEALVTGSITPFGDSVRLAVKILDINTAKMIHAASADIAKTKAIEELLVKGIGGAPATSTAPAQQATTSPRAQVTKSVGKVELGGYALEIIQCKLSGNTLRWVFSITKNEGDRELSLYRPRIIDEFGNEFYATKWQLGANTTTTSYGSVTNVLVSGIPIKGGAEFENVSPDVTWIALLEMKIYDDKEKKIQLRNIHVTK